MLKKISRYLLILWVIWGTAFGSYECLNMRIPEKIRIFQEDAVDVLFNDQEAISPQKLHLDFSGTVAMSENKDGSYQASCKLFGLINLKTVQVDVVTREAVIPGGLQVGIYVETDGVFVIGTGQVETVSGEVAEPAENIIKTGDYIVSFNGKNITGKDQIAEQMKNFQGGEVILGIRRNQETFEVSVTPAQTKEGYCLGIWIRDDTQGIGTLTYLTQDGTFGALGHGISDNDSKLLMEVSGGKLYETKILDIVKGRRGEPGEIAGSINYNKEYLYGQIQKNSDCGIKGTANTHLTEEMKKLNAEPMPIGLKQEIKEGEASILSCVDGTLREYRINITAVDVGESDINKGMKIQVTDENLLMLTGGIIQGMSGSPIIQNGKLVGAVTHVLVNDPTKGYGIFIENMLEH
ncbi:MAG: SpoIVB peptidase [Lachnospiraceae bacterium]